MKPALGTLIIAAIFIGIFLFAWREIGFKGALSVFATAAGLITLMEIAARLINS